MIIIFFIDLIIYGICLTLIEILILDRLTPNYIIIGFELSKIPKIIINDNNNINRWIIIIVSIFQIFFLCFYLEIFKYNFCSWNKNTKKNIIKRERSESKKNKNDENILKDDNYFIELIGLE